MINMCLNLFSLEIILFAFTFIKTPPPSTILFILVFSIASLTKFTIVSSVNFCKAPLILSNLSPAKFFSKTHSNNSLITNSFFLRDKVFYLHKLISQIFF